MIEAVMFDLDGTLIDTETLAMTAGMAAFEQMGYPVEREFLHQLVGVDLPTSDQIVGAAMPLLDQAQLNSLWRTGFSQAMQTGLLLKPGVIELVSSLDIPIAIVTSSGRAEAHQKLELTGLARYFSTVITLQDVTNPKPAPEPYLLGAQRLGVPPERCVVFEDSEPGSQAAHLAGCIVVQVPDVVPSQGRWAHHLATSLLDGARLAGLR
jgi:HAD superfamily hydrolase (TIGR01509 family)